MVMIIIEQITVVMLEYDPVERSHDRIAGEVGGNKDPH